MDKVNVQIKVDSKYAEVARRLQEAVFNLGGNISELSRNYEINYTTLHGWLSAKREPDFMLLADKLKINPVWLMFGVGDIFMSDVKEYSIKAPIESNAELIMAEPRANYDIEFIPIPANVGVGYTFSDMPTKTVVKDVKKSYKKTYKQVRVSGDSMFPSIPDGWYVTFDTNITPANNDVVVATANGVFVVKRFQLIDGHKSLVSDNPVFEKYNFNGGDDVIIHGVVIEISRF